jgi:hypothetical protein
MVAAVSTRVTLTCAASSFVTNDLDLSIGGFGAAAAPFIFSYPDLRPRLEHGFLPSVAMLFQAVPFNALHSQMLYDPNKDPLWGEIKVSPVCACAAAAARTRRRTRRTRARNCVPSGIGGGARWSCMQRRVRILTHLLCSRTHVVFHLARSSRPPEP